MIQCYPMLQHASTPQIAPSKRSLSYFLLCTAIHRPGAVRHFCPRQLTHQPSPPVAVPIPCISKPTRQVVVRVSPPSIPWTLPQGLHLERVQHMLSHLLAGRNLLYDLIVVDQTKQRTHLNSMLVLGTNRCAFRMPSVSFDNCQLFQWQDMFAFNCITRSMAEHQSTTHVDGMLLNSQICCT